MVSYVVRHSAHFSSLSVALHAMPRGTSDLPLCLMTHILKLQPWWYDCITRSFMSSNLCKKRLFPMMISFLYVEYPLLVHFTLNVACFLMPWAFWTSFLLFDLRLHGRLLILVGYLGDGHFKQALHYLLCREIRMKRLPETYVNVGSVSVDTYMKDGKLLIRCCFKGIL